MTIIAEIDLKVDPPDGVIRRHITHPASCEKRRCCTVVYDQHGSFSGWHISEPQTFVITDFLVEVAEYRWHELGHDGEDHYGEPGVRLRVAYDAGFDELVDVHLDGDMARKIADALTFVAEHLSVKP